MNQYDVLMRSGSIARNTLTTFVARTIANDAVEAIANASNLPYARAIGVSVATSYRSV